MTAVCPTDRDALLRRLTTAVDQVDGDELAVVVRIAERLARGRQTYGRLDLEHDRRRFVHETLSELLDGCSYLTMALLRAEREEAAA